MGRAAVLDLPAVLGTAAAVAATAAELSPAPTAAAPVGAPVLVPAPQQLAAVQASAPPAPRTGGTEPVAVVPDAAAEPGTAKAALGEATHSV